MATTIPTIQRTSVQINVQWDKGSTFRHPFLWTSGPDVDNQTPTDLSGCTAAMQLRDENDVLLHEMTTENGGIDLEPASYAPDQLGVIECYISDEDLAGFPWNFAFYDLEIYFANGDTRKLIRGTFTLYNEQTKATP